MILLRSAKTVDLFYCYAHRSHVRSLALAHYMNVVQKLVIITIVINYSRCSHIARIARNLLNTSRITKAIEFWYECITKYTKCHREA